MMARTSPGSGGGWSSALEHKLKKNFSSSRGPGDALLQKEAYFHTQTHSRETLIRPVWGEKKLINFLAEAKLFFNLKETRA